MYSNAASVTRGHHDKSRDLNFRKFSAINSMPSSVIFEHPDKDNTVKFGRVCTEKINDIILKNNKKHTYIFSKIA